jgi:hypothetical protein
MIIMILVRFPVIFVMKWFEKVKQRYYQNAFNAWQGAIAKAAEIEKAVKWLKQLIEVKKRMETPLTRRNTSPDITAQNGTDVATTSLKTTNERRLKLTRMKEGTFWDETMAWGTQEDWDLARDKASDKAKVLFKDVNEAVIKAVDATKDWVVIAVWKARFWSRPEVISECIDILKTYFKLEEKLEKLTRGLRSAQDLTEATAMLQETKTKIDWAKDCIVNELLTIKLHSPKELPKDLSKDIVALQTWSDTLNKTKHLVENTTEITEEMIELALEVLRSVSQSETVSREAARLPPRHVVAQGMDEVEKVVEKVVKIATKKSVYKLCI